MQIHVPGTLDAIQNFLAQDSAFCLIAGIAIFSLLVMISAPFRRK